jgi:hypothetical protein
VGAKLNQKLSVDGLFEIVRTERTRAATATGRLILVSRGGRLFGADAKGRVYLGRLLRQKNTMSLSALRGTYEIPLKRSSLFRAAARNMNVRLPITGEIDPLARRQSATVCVGGKMIDIEISYLGPLPP